ncbi:erythromycin esterase family protein [Candidatus Parcubacteria bacterium]|nr:erythromycin esterase family protein [Candidatus Parcubacteria bacterium]
MVKLAADPVRAIEACARPWGKPEDMDALIDSIGSARFVLLGEATHGTSEYYAWRARLSRRLIREKGFSFIAVEGDWPDCYRVNRYIKHYTGTEKSARQVLNAYKRWPTWMWANRELIPLIEWLRRHNSDLSIDKRAGFYGLDVYSLWDSIHAVVEYLEQTDPAAAEQARQAYSCFEPFSGNGHSYARHTAFVPQSCETDVLLILQLMQKQLPHYESDFEAAFNAKQNALVVANAEHYYRTMIRGDTASWNIRDHHMQTTLTHLMKRYGHNAKAIVWAHNTHVGDARYTDMIDHGMINIGQLAREAHGEEDVYLVGFGSWEGSVIASTAWDGQAQVMSIPPARPESWEGQMHLAQPHDKLILSESLRGQENLNEPRDHRAIGVVYHPGRERLGNYVPTVLPERYDAFIYLDKTSALHPLHSERADDDLPETYPWGM